MKMLNTHLLLSVVALVLTAGGCAQFSGELRPEFTGFWEVIGNDERSERQQAWRDDVMLGSGQTDTTWTTKVQNRQPAGVGTESGVVSFTAQPDLPPPNQKNYRPVGRVTKSDFIDSDGSAGSLWSPGGQTNYFFTKNRVKSVGDIVTLAIEDQLVNEIKSEIRNTLGPNERAAELALAQERLKAKAYGQASVKTEGSAREPASTATSSKDNNQPASLVGAQSEEEKKEIVVPEATDSDIDVNASVKISTGETVMAEVIERFPNGNYKIRAAKRVPYLDGVRVMNIVGVASAEDVEGQEKVSSAKLYEYKVNSIR